MSVKYQELLVVDPAKCTGCEICEAACVFAHEGRFMPGNSRIQRIRIEPVMNFAMSCQFCTDPPCVSVCPQKCMEKDKKTGVIRVNEQKCDGCCFCIKACPFGAITLHSTRKKAIICDMCDSTDEKQPQCARYCPKEAIKVKSVTGLTQESRKQQALAFIAGNEKDKKA